jgi:beta-phosphoglucomutase-like phosphatase (HAD superfamily)/pimeloyl-ACP methyl ester carboxylesterase
MRLHVRAWGDGPQVAILIHGLFSDSRCWHKLGPALADRGYRVLAPDLRGHGASPRGRYSPTDWARDLLDTLPVGPDLAIGHSLGGLSLGVVADVLQARAAVYLDPAWRMDDKQDADSRALWTSWLDWTGPEDLRRVLGSRWSEADLELRWDSMLCTDPGVIPGLASGGGYDLSPESTGARSLVLAADPSEYITSTHAGVLRDRGLQVETVPGSGHSLFREDLPRLLARLDAWLTDPRVQLHPGGARALIFDCDGTLANSHPAHYAALRESLEARGLNFDESWFAAHQSLAATDQVRLFAAEFAADLDIAAVLGERAERYRQKVSAVQPISEVCAIVQDYSGRLPLAVASSGDRAVVEGTLGAIGLGAAFDELVTGDEVEHTKPAPDLFLEAANRLGVRPADCVVYEDSEAGERAARRAGMRVIRVDGLSRDERSVDRASTPKTPSP